MRTSKYSIFTLKHTSLKTSLVSHKLMFRAGMIRKLSSGLYIWLPIGLKILKKIKNIIRKEIDNINGVEISMPIVQPDNLWRKSGRFYEYGLELLKFNDRNNKTLILGPTHEEVITNLVRNEINSYKKLPLIFYQIKTKFRDEMRPCLGVIRSKEFIMKDAYSFHIDEYSLNVTYEVMRYTYCKIFNLIGLKFYIISANNGFIGGNLSHEFHVPINITNIKDYSLLKYNYYSNYSNLKIKSINKQNNLKSLFKNSFLLYITNVEELIIYFFNLVRKHSKVTLISILREENELFINLIILNNNKNNLNKKIEKLHQSKLLILLDNKNNINLIKLIKFLNKIEFCKSITNNYDSIFNNKITILNIRIKEKFFYDINKETFLSKYQIKNLNNINIPNLSKNFLEVKEKIINNENNSIEIGHIFQLGDKYSKSMNATVQNKNGHIQKLIMGCYGIGITRLVSAIIEQNHNEKGILWPENLSPFDIVLLPINIYKSFLVAKVTENLYYTLKMLNFDVLLDDRKESVGIMFADMELIGITHQLIISEKSLNYGNLEYKNILNGENYIISNNNVIDFLLKKVNINKVR